MRRNDLDRAHREFRTWVSEYTNSAGIPGNSSELWEEAVRRYGKARLGLIGAALAEGWLVTRGRYLRARQGDYTSPACYGLLNASRANPTMQLGNEFYVHLSEYARLRPTAEAIGAVLHVEDRDMDLSLVRGDELLAFIEVKYADDVASKLARALVQLGEEGVTPENEKGDSDPVRKARYLARWRAPLLSIRSLGFRYAAKVHYRDEGARCRFELEPLPLPIEDALERTGVSGARGSAPTTLDAKIAELVARLSGEVLGLRRAQGDGQTFAKFYLSGLERAPILAAVGENGELFTGLEELGPRRAAEFAEAMSRADVEIDPEKEWCYWRRRGRRVNLAELDVDAVVQQIAGFVARSVP